MTSVRPKLSAETPKVVTAWDVLTGATVYRTEDGKWSNYVEDAVILMGEAAETALQNARSEESLILDPYVMEVSGDGQVSGRETLRETIRAVGPTTHPDFRKPIRETNDAKSSGQAAHTVW